MDSTGAFDPSKMKAGAEEYSSSDSEEDDDDYTRPSTDPRADEFADFNPRKRRRTGRDAKESAALGIFGSDSEDDRPARSFKRKDLRTKGMSFVSSTDNATKSLEDEDMVDDDVEEDQRGPSMRANFDDDDDDEDDEEQDDDDDDEGTPGIGLGFRSASSAADGWAGLGSPANGSMEANRLGNFSSGGRRAPHKPFLKSKFDSSNPIGRGFVPSSDNQPVLDTTKAAQTPTRPNKAQPSAFSTKNGKTKINASSFGARMMAKMGYQQGQGLGADNTGRQIIIEAPLRPQRVGLGAVKEKTEQERQEEKRQARARGEVVIDSDEEEKKKKADRRRKKSLAGGLRSGTGSAASTPKRQKPKYMTMDEVKKVAPGLNIPDAFTPILDLTGPGGAKKMLTSASGLMTPTGGTNGDEDEVQSKKLVRRAQNDFMAILEEWQGLQERKAFAELQLQQERQELEELEKGVASHHALAEIFDNLLQLEDTNEEIFLNGGDHTKQRWDQIISLLRKANESASELTNHALQEEMAATTVAAVHPVLNDMIQNWDPLQSSRADYASDLESIKGLLGLDKSPVIPQARSSATPYESMMYKLWLPHVSRAVRNWNVRDADCMISMYEAWHPVLPSFVKNYLLEQDIVRKLDEAIAKWEPKRKKHHSMPHLWLFPWLQHLPYHHLDPKSSTGLVADLKRKFRQLIDVWDFDRGVIPGLKEWKNVLRPNKANDQWKPLVMMHILPSMARYLRQNFDVQPSDQEPYLQVLTGVMEWRHIVSPTMVAELVVTEVFPKWHDVLYQWLIDEDVSYDDIAQWCEWWHDADGPFPAEIRDTPSVASEFEKGLHTIERALELFDLGKDPKAALAPPATGPVLTPQAANGHRHASHAHHHHHKPDHRPGPPEDKKRSLRHVVEDWCQENDLQFMPERKQHHSEGPLYRITARGDGKGGKLGYFKGDKLYLLVKNGVEEIGESEGDLERLMTHVM
ncbi:hypothetical protein N0V82_006007 [Gnomoniopsis sp. IMI 355080]|nr:hypothetical protein N0V82_006007 [Gnomoniopsis sp. IMI 355080]